MALPIKVIVGGKTNCCSSALSLKVAKEQTKNIYLLYFKLKLFALHFPFKASFFLSTAVYHCPFCISSVYCSIVHALLYFMLSSHLACIPKIITWVGVTANQNSDNGFPQSLLSVQNNRVKDHCNLCCSLQSVSELFTYIYHRETYVLVA